MSVNNERPLSRHRWEEILYALRRRRVRLLVIAFLAATITLIFWLDYGTGPTREPAALYDVAILVSAASFGVAGVLAVAVAVEALRQLK